MVRQTRIQKRVERNLIEALVSGSAELSEEDSRAFGRMIPVWGSGMTEGALRKEAGRARKDARRSR